VVKLFIPPGGPRLLVVPVVAVALGVAACGGGGGGTKGSGEQGGRPAFKARFSAIDADVKKVGAGIGSNLQRAQRGQIGDAKLADEFDALKTRLSGDLTMLGSVAVPGELKAERDGYEKALRPVADDLGATVGALRAHDAAKGRIAGRNLVLDSSRVKPAANALRSKLGLPITP